MSLGGEFALKESPHDLGYRLYSAQVHESMRALGIEGTIDVSSSTDLDSRIHEIFTALESRRDPLSAMLFFHSATILWARSSGSDVSPEQKLLLELVGIVSGLNRECTAVAESTAEDVSNRLTELAFAFDRQFHSCFISYASADEAFATKLYSLLRDEGVDIWYAPKNIRGGAKLDEQIESALRNYDKVIVVLSEVSVNSDWVKEEIRRSMILEASSGERKLFPIRLIPFVRIKKLQKFVADIVRDIGAEIREYYIPDFTDWQDQESFTQAGMKLVADLKRDSPTRPAPAIRRAPRGKSSRAARKKGSVSPKREQKQVGLRSRNANCFLLGQVLAMASGMNSSSEATPSEAEYAVFVSLVHELLEKLDIIDDLQPISQASLSSNASILTARLKERDSHAWRYFSFASHVTNFGVVGHVPNIDERVFLLAMGAAWELLPEVNAVLDALPDLTSVNAKMVDLMLAVDQQFHSCFISYASADEAFATKLYSLLRDEGIDIWYAPKNVRGGAKLNEQIEIALQNYDKVIVVLSDASINSDWVKEEIRRSMILEASSGERKLFPIRLIPFVRIKKLQKFVADIVRDIGAEIREYYIPDFTDWQDQESFTQAGMKLVADLKRDGSTRSAPAPRRSTETNPK